MHAAFRTWRGKARPIYPATVEGLFPDETPTQQHNRTNVHTMRGSTSLPTLTLVLGGARSGKSGMAERLVTQTGLSRHYIATAEAFDDEMRARIALHQAERGDDWRTWNAPLDLDIVLHAIPSGQIVLVDCVTLWLSNHLLAGSDIAAKSSALLSALQACASAVVVVSNEVGYGIVPENALARAFRDHQGRLNQQLAAQAGLVVGVMAGLPFALKGAIPPA